MSRNKDAVRLAEIRAIRYVHALREIREESSRSGESLGAAGLRLVTEAERAAQAPNRTP
ncbi:hypothetical protein ACFWIB_03435 [Streptomyces sp. NPDC127051]|uniref:hypothetical protein n=1 Tax=Streptomyces sp. NPDC127051 TaxID=3347119 RepID=UPI00364F43DD